MQNKNSNIDIKIKKFIKQFKKATNKLYMKKIGFIYYINEKKHKKSTIRIILRLQSVRYQNRNTKQSKKLKLFLAF